MAAYGTHADAHQKSQRCLVLLIKTRIDIRFQQCIKLLILLFLCLQFVLYNKKVMFYLLCSTFHFTQVTFHFL